MFRNRSRFATCCALVASGALVLAACGGSGEDNAAATTQTTERATTTTAAPIVAPLTGVVDPTGASLSRPALTVKVENTREALPHYGIDQADVIYEEIVEGGITRFAAMFNSHAPDKIGPVRSVRNTDQAIVWPVGGIFGYSGGAPISVKSISAAPVNGIDEDDAGDGMFRDPNRKRPHNLYAVAANLFAKGGEPVPPPALFTYRAGGAPITGVPTASAVVGFRSKPDNAVTWTWNKDSGTWARSSFGSVQTTGTGAPLAPQNVVVQFVDYIGGKPPGGAGLEGSEAQMVGSGRAVVFTGGQMVEGTWQRASKETPTQFLDGGGHPIQLAPGQTWVELLQNGYSLTTTPAENI
jgi:Protein of unknown function (DUF3048) N-terminal domain/Protein of unknown function (DUF3048) C-terminal domain